MFGLFESRPNWGQNIVLGGNVLLFHTFEKKNIMKIITLEEYHQQLLNADWFWSYSDCYETRASFITVTI